MKTRTRRRSHSAAAGLTLAEVAVTIAIVSVTILQCLQGIDRSVLTAAHTRNNRLARELGLLRLTEIEVGLMWDDIDSGLGGSFVEEGYPSFFYEIALGEDTFVDVDPNESRFDSWAYRDEVRRLQDEENGYDDEEEDEDPDDHEPYEKVRVKVSFVALTDYPHELILERWIPWEQVYGPDEEDGEGDGSSDSGSGGPSKDG